MSRLHNTVGGSGYSLLTRTTTLLPKQRNLLAAEVLPVVPVLAGGHHGLAEEADGEVHPEAAAQTQRGRLVITAPVAHNPRVHHVRLRRLHRPAGVTQFVKRTKKKIMPGIGCTDFDPVGFRPFIARNSEF